MPRTRVPDQHRPLLHAVVVLRNRLAGVEAVCEVQALAHGVAFCYADAHYCDVCTDSRVIDLSVEARRDSLRICAEG